MAPDVGTDRPAGDRAAHRRGVVVLAADLVAEDPAYDRAGDGAADVRLIVARLDASCRSIQQRCSGGPTTARTYVTGAS